MSSQLASNKQVAGSQKLPYSNLGESEGEIQNARSVQRKPLDKFLNAGIVLSSITIIILGILIARTEPCDCNKSIEDNAKFSTSDNNGNSTGIGTVINQDDPRNFVSIVPLSPLLEKHHPHDFWLMRQLRYMMGDFFMANYSKEFIVRKQNHSNPTDYHMENHFRASVKKILGYAPPIIYESHEILKNEYGYPTFTSLRDYGRRDIILWPRKTIDDPTSIKRIGAYPDLSSELADTIVWRGSTTGKNFFEDPNSRYNIIKKIFSWPNVDVGFDQNTLEGKDKQRAQEYVRPAIGEISLFRYPYILCLEGDDISELLPIVLNSPKSVAFHPYPFKYESTIHAGLTPWEHFIPLKPDASDLMDKLHYAKSNPAEITKIIKAANQYIEPYKNDDQMEQIRRRILNRYTGNMY